CAAGAERALAAAGAGVAGAAEAEPGVARVRGAAARHLAAGVPKFRAAAGLHLIAAIPAGPAAAAGAGAAVARGFAAGTLGESRLASWAVTATALAPGHG